MPKTLTPEDLLYGDTLQGLANPKQLAEEAKANNFQLTQAPWPTSSSGTLLY
jgi:hypothetical protein